MHAGASEVDWIRSRFVLQINFKWLPPGVCVTGRKAIIGDYDASNGVVCYECWDPNGAIWAVTETTSDKIVLEVVGTILLAY